MIDQGVTAALTTRDANRNGDDSHTSGTGARRTTRFSRIDLQDFMEVPTSCLSKATEGVVELTQCLKDGGMYSAISTALGKIRSSSPLVLFWQELAVVEFQVRFVGHDVGMQCLGSDLRNRKMTGHSTVCRLVADIDTEVLGVQNQNMQGRILKWNRVDGLRNQLFMLNVKLRTRGTGNTWNGACLWEEEKPIKTLTTLKTRLKLKREKLSTLA
ncbi:hypothetical protein Tco_0149288 [Tanacetum coccineum]